MSHLSQTELLHHVRELAQNLCCQLNPLIDDQSDYNSHVRFRRVSQAMDHCLASLEALQLWGKSNQGPSQAFWEIAGPLLSLGSLQRQARAKPRGYAGDFELLHKICQHECCDHHLGRYFDLYFQDHAAPQAVRNRYELVGRQIVELVQQTDDRNVHVASVGAGPAKDLQHAGQWMSARRTSTTADNAFRRRCFSARLCPTAIVYVF